MMVVCRDCGTSCDETDARYAHGEWTCGGGCDNDTGDTE